jgi:hypothetical protein
MRLTVQSAELALNKFDEYASMPLANFPKWSGLTIGTVPAVKAFNWED